MPTKAETTVRLLARLELVSRHLAELDELSRERVVLVAELRSRGVKWDDLATRCGVTRQALMRALGRGRARGVTP